MRPEDAANVVRSHGIDRELVKQKLSTHVQNVLTEEQPLSQILEGSWTNNLPAVLGY